MNSESLNFRPVYQLPFIGDAPFHVKVEKIIGGFGAHWHGEIEILYVLPDSDPITVTIDEKSYLLSAHDSIFISGAEIHSVKTEKAQADILVIEMGFSLLGNDFSVFTGKKFVNPLLRTNTATELIFKEIAEICGPLEGAPCEWTPVNRLKIASLLFKLAAITAETMQMSPAGAGKAKQLEALLSVQSVLSLVEQAYPEPLSVEYVASFAGYEKTRFCQLFKSAVGVSFHKYLNNRRMRAAELMLKGTNLPVSEIARSVGIPHHKTFSRLIKETYGITPTELRFLNTKE